jgi:transitional endoplasmic reticulum ATPase
VPNAERARKLLCRHCEELALAPPQAELNAWLACLSQTTPDDFAAVLRQHRFRPIESAVALLGALKAECVVKEGKKRFIGFLISPTP